MAGDWIKWSKGLPNKPEVVRLAGMLGLPRLGVAKQLAKDFPNNFAGIIYFDSAYTDWDRDIKEFLITNFG